MCLHSLGSSFLVLRVAKCVLHMKYFSVKHRLHNYVDVMYNLDSLEVLDRVTGVMTRGAQKYTEHNWKQAEGEEELNRFAESMLRHLLQFVREEDDEDHLAAVWFNIGGIEYVISKIE